MAPKRKATSRASAGSATKKSKAGAKKATPASPRGAKAKKPVSPRGKKKGGGTALAYCDYADDDEGCVTFEGLGKRAHAAFDPPHQAATTIERHGVYKAKR